MKRKIILNTKQINQKITRIAHQIIESNIDEKEVIIAGIEKNGYIIAIKLKKILVKFMLKKFLVRLKYIEHLTLLE